MEKVEKKDMTFLATVIFVNSYEVMFCLATTMNHEMTKFRGVSVVEYAFVRNLINFLIVVGVLTY